MFTGIQDVYTGQNKNAEQMCIQAIRNIRQDVYTIIQDKMTIGHEAYDEKKIKEASMNIIKSRRQPNEDVNKDIKLILRGKKQGRKTNNQDVDNNNDTRLLMRTK